MKLPCPDATIGDIRCVDVDATHHTTYVAEAGRVDRRGDRRRRPVSVVRIPPPVSTAAWMDELCTAPKRHTTIFVAPQGIGNGWANSNGEDVTFTDDMIRLIENDLCVDTTQLFSVGFSYGGAMSYSLACSRATVFRAVAAAPGAISGCSGGTQPIAYMGIHGVNDSIQNGRALRDTFVRN